MTNILRLALASALVLAMSGCWLAPKTTALKDVHEIYEDEFIELFLAEPSQQPFCLSNLAQDLKQPTFSRTRAAIRAYRLRFGTESAESAHLTVLDAMMHVQVGNVGLARLSMDRVETAKQRLGSETGSVTRDYLFAENIGPLISGWDVVCDLASSKPVSEPADKLASAAETIRKGLIARKNAGSLADPSEDQGAVYLATTSAIFEHWASVQQRRRCVEQGVCPCPANAPECTSLDNDAIRAQCRNEATVPRRAACEMKKRAEFFDTSIAPSVTDGRYAASRDLIGLFLDEPERDLSLCMSKEQIKQTVSSPRLRYLVWHKDSNDLAGTKKNGCPDPQGGGS